MKRPEHSSSNSMFYNFYVHEGNIFVKICHFWLLLRVGSCTTSSINSSSNVCGTGGCNEWKFYYCRVFEVEETTERISWSLQQFAGHWSTNTNGIAISSGSSSHPHGSGKLSYEMESNSKTHNLMTWNSRICAKRCLCWSCSVQKSRFFGHKKTSGRITRVFFGLLSSRC